MWIKARRILGILLVSAVFVLGNSGMVSAEQALPDVDRIDCSITLSPQSVESHEVVPNTQFTAWRVGEVKVQEGMLRYSPAAEFAESGIALSNLNAENLVEELEVYAESNCIQGITQTADEAGVVSFEDLSTGVYLLKQDAVPEGYETVSSFLVTVPMEDLKGDGYVYEVNARPKAGAIAPDRTKPSGDTSLPQTGQLNWPVPVLAAAGVGLFVIGYGLRTKEKKR